MVKRKKPKKAASPTQGMLVREREDGTTTYTPLVKIDGKQKSLGTFVDLDEARAIRHAYFKQKADKGQRTPKHSGVFTVAELGAMCLKDAPRWDRDRWKARILDMAEFAKWPAIEVGAEHVQVWIDQMAQTPIEDGPNAGQPPTRPTLQSALSLLRRVYSWARKPARKYVSKNPCDGVTISNSTDVKLKSNVNLLDYLREDEAKLLLEAKTDRIPLEAKAKFVTIMIAGTRPADVWRLDWSRFDWSNESIVFSSTKTGSFYTVHPLPQLLAIMREWWMASGRPTSGLVFPAGVDEEGNQMVYARGYDAGWQDKKERRRYNWSVDNTPDKRLSATHTHFSSDYAKWLRHLHGEKKSAKGDLKVTKGWRSKLGIKRDVPLYALKHTCASHLLLGTPLFTGGRQWSREEVQSQLGHKDSKSTEAYMRSLGILGQRAAKESKAALKLQKKGKR